MASLRRLVIPATLAMTFVGTSFLACESDGGDDDVGPIGGSGDPPIADAPPPNDAGDGDAIVDADPIPDVLSDAPPDAPVG